MVNLEPRSATLNVTRHSELSDSFGEATAIHEQVESDLSRTDATAAVSALFHAHFSGLVRLAMCLVDDRGVAEDVVQDAFVSLYRHWTGLRHEDSALAYLRSAVLRRSRSHLRTVTHLRRRSATHADLPTPPDDLTAATAARHTERDDLRQAVRALPTRQRQVIVARYYLDMSELQIADVLGISPGSVKRHAHRALLTLTRAVEASL